MPSLLPPITYGKALYYPFIHFHDLRWLKTAALYYDGLFRMVPEEFNLQDDDYVKRLVGELGFVENLDTWKAAKAISEPFLEYFEHELGKEKQRAALYKKLSIDGRQSDLVALHRSKITGYVAHKLHQMGASTKPRRKHKEFLEIEPATAAIYMTYLAKHISAEKRAPVVTENSFFHPLLQGMADSADRSDPGAYLASMVIRAAVPASIEDLSISKIKQFRKKHADERLLFYKEINTLLKELKGVTDQDIFNHVVRNQERQIAIATDNLVRSYRGIGINAGIGLFSLSVPNIVATSGAAAVAGGVGLMFVGKTIAAAIDYNKTKKISPHAYVLSLRKLRRRSFLGQVLKGEILF